MARTMRSNAAPSMRNPKWSRDEIIITLDFYFKHYPRIPNQKSDEIAALSQRLRALTNKLGNELTETYRNPNGVYMKLMNLHGFNEHHSGKGLKAGSKLDEEVFKEYADNRKHLAKVAAAINSWTLSDIDIEETERTDEVTEAEEGRLLTRVHRSRERDRKIVEKKKAAVLHDTGHLACECCGFDFQLTYGEVGAGFIECHHIRPVSEMKPGDKTSLDDLSLVCSNCHKMIHRKRPWLSVNELSAILKMNFLRNIK